MTFLDWWGFTGTGIQSVFAWIGYNRDAFADNVSMRQAQKYQQKNYQISWIAIARDDIRDMMGISVNRINNYMIVATLILSVAAGSVVSVSFNERCPAFVVFAFYLSIGVSLIYLMLAIMFGVKGQNSAFTNTMKLMTYQVRPENPAEYSHDYMKQAQWIERVGLKALFRVPGVLPAYATDPSGGDEAAMKDKCQGELRPSAFPSSGARQTAAGRAAAAAGAGAATGSGARRYGARDLSLGQAPEARPGTYNMEDATPLESLFKRTTHTWYLTKFAQFMRLWQPYDTYSKYSMGLGIVALGQGSAYFSLGHLSSQDRFLSEWAACVLTFAFVYIMLLVTMQNFKARNPNAYAGVIFLLTAGPCLGAIGAVTELEWLRQLVVPFCFLCHTLFWVVAFVIAMGEINDRTLDFVANGWDFWGEKGVDEVGEDGDAGRRRSPEAERASEADWRRDAAQERGERECSEDRRGLRAPCRSTASGAPGGGEDAPKDASDHWPTDDDEFAVKALATSNHIKQTVRCTLITSAVLWFSMFVWAVAQYWIDPLTMSVREAMGPTAAVLVEEMEIAWPGPLFRPQSVACAGGRIFATDGFRVFELGQSRSSAPTQSLEVPCGVGRPIVDLSAVCDASGCRPVALVRSAREAAGSAPSEVVDCRAEQGQAKPLLQDDVLAELLAVSPSGSGEVAGLEQRRLLTSRSGGELVQFVYSSYMEAWSPEWLLGWVGFFAGDSSVQAAQADELPAAMSAGEERLLLFRSTAHEQRAAIEARTLDTLVVQSRWQLPAGIGPLSAGCAWGEAEALVLPSPSSVAPGGALGGSAPRLLRVSLPL